jgi:hypothetical protein
MEQRSIFVTVGCARSGYTTRVVGPGVLSTCHPRTGGHGIIAEDRLPACAVSLAESYCKSSMVDATLHDSTRTSRHQKSAGSYHITHAHAGTAIESHQEKGHHVPS